MQSVPTGHRAMILAMAFVAGCVVANIYFAQPMLPLIAADLHVPAASIGLIPGFSLAGFALGLALLLPLGDRYDRRIIVLVQIGLAALFALAAALAPSFPLLLAACLGLGCVSCVPQQLVPFAAQISPPAERGRSVGTVVSGIMMGLLLGRTVGGGLSALVGWRPVFGFAAALMALLTVATAFLLPKGAPTTDLSYPRLLASLWPLLRRHGALRRAMATQALLWVCFNAFWANLATLLIQGPYKLGPFWAGAFGVVGLVGALAATAGGRGSDRMGPMRVLSISIAIVFAAYLVMSVAAASMIALIAGVILLDLGCQSALVSNQTSVMALDPQAQGRVNTLYMTTIFLGGAIGAAISGWAMARFGWEGVIALGLVSAALAGVLHATGERRRAASTAARTA